MPRITPNKLFEKGGMFIDSINSCIRTCLDNMHDKSNNGRASNLETTFGIVFWKRNSQVFKDIFPKACDVYVLSRTTIPEPDKM